MRVGSLFAGIGGFDLGLERAGMHTAWQVEIDPYCRAVLAKHFHDAERFEDVRDVGAHNLAPVDVICGGFPCQDISLAGKGAGIDGERSGLWSEMWRVICELGPRWVVVENVPALTSRGLDRVLRDLAEGGYDAEWDCISAAALGAPHRRERIWIVAYPREERREWGPREQGTRRASAERSQTVDHAGNSRRASVADTPGVGQRESTDQEDAEPDSGNARTLSSRGDMRGRAADEGRPADDALRRRHGPSQGEVRPGRDGALDAGWWATEPDVGRVVARFPARLDGGWLDADAASEGTREILQALRGPDGAQALQWTARGLGGVQAANVLLAALCEPEGSPEALGDLSLASPPAPRPVMRSVRVDGSAACSPCRRAATEQRAEQHPDALRVLPRLLTCDCGATRLDPTGTATATENRVDRLSALGNALVPQIAEWIGRRIIDWEAELGA